MSPYVVLAPEIILLVGAVVVLFAEWLPGGRSGAPYWGAAFSTAAALAVTTGGAEIFGSMLAYDSRTAFARVAIAALTAVFLLWLGARGMGSGNPQAAASLAMFSSLGGLLLVAANDLIVLYMALELSTMPAYVMIGYDRKDARGLEGALKYFLLSMLTSLIMVYGLSFLYGLSGATSYAALDVSGAGVLGLFVGLFVLVGFLAKLSAAPFHYWTPDAYEGASPHAVAFVSTVPKVSGLVAMVVLFSAVMPSSSGLALAAALAAAASVVLGNLAAYPQSDMRRLMAYSGIAHSGYLMMGLAASTEAGVSSAIFYAVAYAIPSMGAMLVFAEHGAGINDLKGLAARRPWVAWAVVGFFLSLVGIPPTVGFFGKLYLFGAALDAAWVWLVVLAFVMSVASLGYYFRVVREMFFSDGEAGAPRPSRSIPAGTAIAVLLAATFLMGVAGSPLMSLMGLDFP